MHVTKHVSITDMYYGNLAKWNLLCLTSQSPAMKFLKPERKLWLELGIFIKFLVSGPMIQIIASLLVQHDKHSNPTPVQYYWKASHKNFNEIHVKWGRKLCIRSHMIPCLKRWGLIVAGYISPWVIRACRGHP